MQARRLTIHGRVQGVSMRDGVRRAAQRHDVRGWVRNEPDGTVAAHLEGEADAVEAVVDWIAGGGPPAARVDRVEPETVEVEGHEGFAVR